MAKKPSSSKKPNKNNNISFSEMTKNNPFLEQSKKNEAAEKDRLKKAYESTIANDPYMNMYNQHSGMLNSQAASQRQYQQGILNQSTGEINTGYDKGANNAYINYRQSQMALPEQMSNLGATGGTSESSAIRLQSAYAQNLNENEAARNEALASARNNYASNINNINSSLSSALSDAYQYYGGMSTDWLNAQREQYEADLRAAEIDGWNERVMSNINKRKGQGWDVITWEDSEGKLHYLKDNGATYLKNQEKKNQAAINNANNRTYAQGQKLADQGYNVKYTTDKNGIVSVAVTSKKK